jgi:hypothetical protein
VPGGGSVIWSQSQTSGNKFIGLCIIGDHQPLGGTKCRQTPETMNCLIKWQRKLERSQTRLRSWLPRLLALGGFVMQQYVLEIKIGATVQNRLTQVQADGASKHI